MLQNQHYNIFISETFSVNAKPKKRSKTGSLVLKKSTYSQMRLAACLQKSYNMARNYFLHGPLCVGATESALQKKT